jgi:DNA polymerase III subunit epsilon
MSDAAHTVSGMNHPQSDGTARPAPASVPWLLQVGVFDLETTGVDVREDRIVTAHVGVLDASGRILHSRDWLADPGIPIPEGAAAIHGVTTEHAREHGRPAADVVREVVHALDRVFAVGIPVVAYNAPFDFSLLASEARRHGIPPVANPYPVIDPLVVDKAYDRWRPGKRTLEVVAAHYGVPLDSAHEASADAVAAGRVAQAVGRRFAAWMPPTAHELHTRQIAWARAQAASLTEYFIQIGRIDPHDRLDGSWPLR